MSDLFTTPVVAKIASGLGGLLGGIGYMFYMKPNNVWDAAVRSSVCTIVSIIGAPFLLQWLGFNRLDWELTLAAGTFIGFVSWTAISYLARTLLRIEDQKISGEGYVRHHLDGVNVNIDSKGPARRGRPPKH